MNTTAPRAAAAAWPQTLVGACVLLSGLGLAAGALSLPSEAGYGGVGPNFLPWLVAVVLAICGGWMIWESVQGGFSNMPEDAGGGRANVPALVWVSAGLLANAALITALGFILSCTLCYVLAVQGLRRAEGQAGVNRPATWAVDAATGIALSAPVFWMFTQFLAISLPGLTQSGWF